MSLHFASYIYYFQLSLSFRHIFPILLLSSLTFHFLSHLLNFITNYKTYFRTWQFFILYHNYSISMWIMWITWWITNLSALFSHFSCVDKKLSTFFSTLFTDYTHGWFCRFFVEVAQNAECQPPIFKYTTFYIFV